MIKIFRISVHTLVIAILGSWLAVNAEEEQFGQAVSEVQRLGSLSIFIIVIAILVMGALLAWFLITRRPAIISNEKEGRTKKDFLNYFKKQIMEMIATHGGELSLEEIGHNLNMPSNVIDAELWKMEKEGLITRKWADKYMFDIKKQSEINIGICCISG
jgi:hypothetical protein